VKEKDDLLQLLERDKTLLATNWSECLETIKVKTEECVVLGEVVADLQNR
jgi:hypothetical protein